MLRVELNRGEVSRQLPKGAGTAALLRRLASGMQERAGEGYSVSEHAGRKRTNVSVGAATKEAWRDNLENNTLLKAMR